MKKILSIILISVLLSNFLDYYVLFRIMQNNIQREIKYQIRTELKDNELTVIPANDIENIHWIKTGKEFKYKGEMFDIIRTKTKDKKKFYYCIWDKKEKKLIAAYNKIRNHKNKNKRANKLLKIKLFFQNIGISTIQNESNIVYFKTIADLARGYLRITSPPPKMV